MNEDQNEDQSEDQSDEALKFMIHNVEAGHRENVGENDGDEMRNLREQIVRLDERTNNISELIGSRLETIKELIEKGGVKTELRISNLKVWALSLLIGIFLTLILMLIRLFVPEVFEIVQSTQD